MKFNKLAIEDKNELVFGNAPNPVLTPRGLNIGGGTVYPELNFTLPSMTVSRETLKEVLKHYKQIANGALKRAYELHSDGVILEFESLIEMTKTPDIGVEIVKAMNEICEEYYQKKGLKSEIRLTPNDLREFERPPKQRTSELIHPMMELFERGAEAGGNLLSIETTGGKEISDDALMMCDIKQFMFSQTVLGVRDMKMIWNKIVSIANKTGVIPGGDTACGFGNTAMVLAEKQYIPRVFAAIARIITVVRTIVAIEEGAKGPDKDCGYEGPFLKAITGIPISMEGKSAACAHLSPVGNVAAACCDLWSNESVQNIKLLADMAPTVYMEQLIYDTRLMNQATLNGKGAVLNYQQLLIDSDIFLDPQALILAPEHVISISHEIVKGKTYIEAARLGSLKGLQIIRSAYEDGLLKLDDKEIIYLDILQYDIESIPNEEPQFLDMIMPTIDHSKLLLKEYGL